MAWNLPENKQESGIPYQNDETPRIESEELELEIEVETHFRHIVNEEETTTDNQAVDLKEFSTTEHQKST